MGAASCQDEATKVNLFTQERNGILSQAVETCGRPRGNNILTPYG